MRYAPSAILVMATLACCGVGATTASAADLSAHPVLDEDSLIPEEIGTGWYLRGDIGYSFNDVGTVRHNGAEFGGRDTDNSFFGTIGFGYQFDDMIRAELTLDKINNYDVTSRTSCAPWTLASCTAGVDDPTSERTTIGALALMLNAYTDLGTWYGITPYVGAGVGAAYVDVSGHRSTNAGDTSASRTFGGYETWALAANLAAGASYTVAEGLMLDVGYRFLWIDSGRSGGSPEGEVGSVAVRDLTAHQIRAGLRYYLF